MAAEQLEELPFGERIREVINTNADILDGKADLVGGLVPLSQLKEFYLSGGTGTGLTPEDPYVVGGGLSTEALVEYFQNLPGWAPDKVLQGDMTWVDAALPPDAEQLEATAITFGTPGGTGVQVNWEAVPSGVTYTLQRDTTNAFTSPVTRYSGPNLTFEDTGLTPETTYYYRVKVTASGFIGSEYAVANVTTDEAGTEPGVAWFTAPVQVENQVWNPTTHSAESVIASGLYRSRFSEHIPINTEGYVQGIIDYGTQIELDTDASNFNGNPAVILYKNYPSGKVEAKVGSSYLTLSGSESGITYARLSATDSGTMWLFQFSRDGVVWQGDQTIAKANINPFYTRVRDNNPYGDEPSLTAKAISQLKGKNLSI